LKLLFIGAAVGVGATLVAWGFFRKPGVPFFTLAPLWRAKQHLNSVGAALWLYGCIAGSVLIVAHYVIQHG
jgi:hypothetical protein